MHFNMIGALATVFVQMLITTHLVPVNAQLFSGSGNMPIAGSFGAAAATAAGVAKQMVSEEATGTMKMGATVNGGAPVFDANKMNNAQQGSIGFQAGSSLGGAAAAAGVAKQMVSGMASQASTKIANIDIANKTNMVRSGTGGAAATIRGKFSMSQPQMTGGTTRNYTSVPLAKLPTPTGTYRPMTPSIQINANQ